MVAAAKFKELKINKKTNSAIITLIDKVVFLYNNARRNEYEKSHRITNDY